MAMTEEERKVRRLAQGKVWRDANKDAIAARKKLYRQENKEKVKKLAHQSYLRNKEKSSIRQKEYRKENPGMKKSHDVAYRKRNKDAIRQRMIVYLEKNKGKVAEQKHEHYLQNKQTYVSNATKSNQKSCVALNDTYIKRVISSKSSLGFKDIPQSLINAKRAYIKGLRLIKEQEDERQKD